MDVRRRPYIYIIHIYRHPCILLHFKTLQKRSVRMKNAASGFDQCVRPVGVVAGYGHWVGH